MAMLGLKKCGAHCQDIFYFVGSVSNLASLACYARFLGRFFFSKRKGRPCQDMDQFDNEKWRPPKEGCKTFPSSVLRQAAAEIVIFFILALHWQPRLANAVLWQLAFYHILDAELLHFGFVASRRRH